MLADFGEMSVPKHEALHHIHTYILMDIYIYTHGQCLKITEVLPILEY